jgi:2-(1,2-epoxy-1,2-dihydrophenyl)acetyl-CoA isomerase
VPGDAVEAEALALAEKLAAGPTRAFGRTKELLRGSSQRALGDALALESDTISVISAEPDAGEGIDAFVEKRAARFRGL